MGWVESVSFSSESKGKIGNAKKQPVLLIYSRGMNPALELAFRSNIQVPIKGL